MTSRADPMLGRTLGDFVIRERIGAGGVGEVFRAEQVTLGREAVIKVLARNRDLGTQAADRFLREARMASRLDHPFAAHVYAFGAEPDGMLWIAMELVRGIPLDRLISTQGPLPLARFVPFFERLAEVLYAAHEQGIVHRDVKPANVMVLSRTGRLLPKLLDLGIARTETVKPASRSIDVTLDLDSISDSVLPEDQLQTSAELLISRSNDITLAGMVIGTPHFMAPEQWSDASKADVRSDLYSLAILAYQAITGRLPFKGHSLRSMARAHAQLPLPELGEGVPEALYPVLAKATAKKPADRYATALELATALRVASGLEFEPASLPQIDDGLRETVLAEAPQPIAEAVAMLEAARTPRQAVDAVAAIQRVVTRHVAMMAMAARARIGAGGDDDTEEVTALLKRSAAGRIDDDAWRALTAGLVLPFANRREAYPVPELVSGFFTTDGQPGMGALALDRLSQLRWPNIDAPQEELISFLNDAVPAAGQVLSTLSFLFDYALVVRRNDAERWMGTRRARRAPHEVLGPLPEDGQVALLDSAGSVVLTLSPLVQLIAPSGGAAEELFYLDGPGRHGARFVAFPGPFERQDPELWRWFSENITDVMAPVARAARGEAEPYKGLSAFTAADTDHYFGREKEAQSFTNRLRVSPLLAVVGPSGAGKSSFIMAGVVPLLPKGWRSVIMRPGNSPLAALAQRLTTENLGAEGFAAKLLRDPLALAKQAAVALGPGETLVLVVDQFEELVTLCADVEERQAFVAALQASADLAGSRVRVVMTLRDDFLIQITQLTAFRDRLSSALQLLGTPAAEDLMRVVIEPARRVGFGFDDETLPKRMVDAVAEHPGALALLSFTASQLWALRDRHLRQMRAKTYEAIGGVGGALANHAEKTLGSFPAGEQRLVREAFRQLVTGQSTRAVLSRTELLEVLGGDDTAFTVLNTLINARLLITGEGEGQEDRTELIHESLIHSWPRLVNWLREDAETARLRDSLRSSAKHWHERGHTRGLLWRDETLAEYRLWKARFTGGLTNNERAFAQASEEAEARGQMWRRGLAVAAFVTLTIGLILVSQAYRQADTALQESLASERKAQQRLANLRQEQGRLAMLENKPLEALAYLDAARSAGATGPAMDHMLKLATWLTRGEVRRFGEAEPSLNDVLSPDQKTLAIFHEGHVTIWDVETGNRRAVIQTTARSGAFAPDGTFGLLTTEGRIDFVRPLTGALASSLDIGPGRYFFLNISSNGQTLALSGVGDRIRIIRRDGSQVTSIALTGAPRISTEASLDGRLVAVFAGPSIITPNTTHEVCVIELSTGEEIFRSTFHEPARQVRFGPGNRLAVGLSEGTLSLWSLNSKRRLWAGAAQAGPIQVLSFSPDGDRLMSLGYDGKLALWDTATGRNILTQAIAAAPLRAGFWLDASMVAIQMPDGVIQKFNSRTGERDWRFVGSGPRTSLWNTDHGLIAAGHDGIVRVWDQFTSGGPARLSNVHAKAAFGSPWSSSQPVRTTEGWFVAAVDGDDAVKVKAPSVYAEGDFGAQLSADGDTLVRISQGTVQVLKRETGFELSQTLTSTNPFFWLATDSHGEQLAAQSTSGDMVFFAGSPLVEVASIHPDSVGRTVGFFSESGDLVVASSTGELERWNVKKGQKLSVIKAAPSAVLPVPSTVKDRFFAIAPNGLIQVWSLSSTSLIGEVPGMGVEPLAVALDDSSRILSEWTPDGTWSVWDLEERRLVSRVPTVGQLTDAAVSGAGVSLISTSGSLVRWPATTPTVSDAQVREAIACDPQQLQNDRLIDREGAKLVACSTRAIP